MRSVQPNPGHKWSIMIRIRNDLRQILDRRITDHRGFVYLDSQRLIPLKSGSVRVIVHVLCAIESVVFTRTMDTIESIKETMCTPKVSHIIGQFTK